MQVECRDAASRRDETGDSQDGGKEADYQHWTPHGGGMRKSWRHGYTGDAELPSNQRAAVESKQT